MIFDQTRIYTSFLKLAAQMSYSEALKILGLKGNPTEEEIKKAYKIKAIENHPDRGGDVAVMAQINVAKDVLMKNLGGVSPKDTGSYSEPPVQYGPFYKKETATSEFDSIKQEYESYLKKAVTGIATGKIGYARLTDPESGIEADYEMFVKVFAVKDKWVFYAQKYRRSEYEYTKVPGGFNVTKKLLNVFYENHLSTLPISKDIRKEGFATVSNVCKVSWQDVMMPVPTDCVYDGTKMSWVEAFNFMHEKINPDDSDNEELAKIEIFDIFLTRESGKSAINVFIPGVGVESFSRETKGWADLFSLAVTISTTFSNRLFNQNVGHTKENLVTYSYRKMKPAEAIPFVLGKVKSIVSSGKMKAAIQKTIDNFGKVGKKPSPRKKKLISNDDCVKIKVL